MNIPDAGQAILDVNSGDVDKALTQLENVREILSRDGKLTDARATQLDAIVGWMIYQRRPVPSTVPSPYRSKCGKFRSASSQRVRRHETSCNRCARLYAGRTS